MARLGAPSNPAARDDHHRVALLPRGLPRGRLHLGETVEISVVYQFPIDRFSTTMAGSADDLRSVLLKKVANVRVANLGFITTFPIVSEITAAAKAKSPKDVESSSSIPISWVFSILGTKPTDSVAVTFSWKISYNWRAAPDFAKYFSVYPHVTLIAPTSQGTGNSTKLAVGLGTSVAQVFNFAWAVKPASAPACVAGRALTSNGLEPRVGFVLRALDLPVGSGREVDLHLRARRSRRRSAAGTP